MKKNYFMMLFWGLMDTLALGLVSATLAGFLGKLWWIFDLTSHFQVQYLLGLLVVLLVNVMGKRRRSAIIVGVFFLANFVLIAPLFLDTPAVDLGEQKTYRILYANILTENQQHHLVRELIDETDPDFVVLLEVNQEWLDELDLSEMGFLFSITEARADNFGIALFSRIPLEKSAIHRFGRLDLPSIVATVNDKGIPITFVATHPVPPKSEQLTSHRNIHMSELADFISTLAGNIVLAGDLNATSWSPFFREWLRVSQLQDSRRGFGVQPTWPTYNWLLSIPIDHFLISPEIQIHHREVGPQIGSDHYPLLMDFSILDKADEN